MSRVDMCWTCLFNNSRERQTDGLISNTAFIRESVLNPVVILLYPCLLGNRGLARICLRGKDRSNLSRTHTSTALWKNLNRASLICWTVRLAKILMPFQHFSSSCSSLPFCWMLCLALQPSWLIRRFLKEQSISV